MPLIIQKTRNWNSFFIVKFANFMFSAEHGEHQ
jgi:hypothetical protein